MYETFDMAVLMLSRSSPSTTSRDWAGLKWNWTHKYLFVLKEIYQLIQLSSCCSSITEYVSLLDEEILHTCYRVAKISLGELVRDIFVTKTFWPVLTSYFVNKCPHRAYNYKEVCV